LRVNELSRISARPVKRGIGGFRGSGHLRPRGCTRDGPALYTAGPIPVSRSVDADIEHACHRKGAAADHRFTAPLPNADGRRSPCRLADSPTGSLVATSASLQGHRSHSPGSRGRSPCMGAFTVAAQLEGHAPSWPVACLPDQERLSHWPATPSPPHLVLTTYFRMCRSSATELGSTGPPRGCTLWDVDRDGVAADGKGVAQWPLNRLGK